MVAPTPALLADAPFEVLDGRMLFSGPPVRRRSAPSVRRLEGSGRLLLTFTQVSGGDRSSEGALMLSTSDDRGGHWAEPVPLYAYPGWFCMSIGGLARISDDLVRLFLGRIQFDFSLAGTEPMTGWHVCSTYTTDGGASWASPGPEIRLFPTWTELYGASNPHPLSDGGLLWAVSGTIGRDVEWQAGVSRSDPRGQTIGEPTLIAAAPDRDYSDTDLVRLADGRFLAVVREHQTLQSVQSWSSDEGRTWSELEPTPFKASNPKLFRLRSGAVVCAYRDEDPARRGVSASVTWDGGASWQFIGQLYAAPPDAEHRPGSVCGYPDMVSLGGDEVGAVLHTYPTRDGVELQWLRLRDRSAETPAARSAGAPEGRL